MTGLTGFSLVIGLYLHNMDKSYEYKDKSERKYAVLLNKDQLAKSQSQIKSEDYTQGLGNNEILGVRYQYSNYKVTYYKFKNLFNKDSQALELGKETYLAGNFFGELSLFTSYEDRSDLENRSYKFERKSKYYTTPAVALYYKDFNTNLSLYAKFQTTQSTYGIEFLF